MTSCSMPMPCDPTSSFVCPQSETANDGDFRKLMIRLEMTHKSEIEQLQHQIRLLRLELKNRGLFPSTPVEAVNAEQRLQSELQSVGRTCVTPKGASGVLASPRIQKQPQIHLEPSEYPIPMQDASELDGEGVRVGKAELESRGGRDSAECPSRRFTGSESNGAASLVKIDTNSSSSSIQNEETYDEDEAKRRRATRQSFASRSARHDTTVSQTFISGGRTSPFRDFFKSILSSVRFEAFFSVVMMTNCIFLGITADVRAMYPGDEEHLAFKIAEYCYTGLFTAELLIRILGDGPSVYCDVEKMHWYYLDTFVVATSLVEVALEVVQNSGQGMSFSGARVFRVIRIIRIIKVIRVVRVVRFVRALRTLVLSIVHTMSSVMWAFVLLLAIIYVFGMVFVQVVTEHAQSNTVDQDDPLMVFWGTLPRSMFTLYKSIASGISWHEVVQPLADIASSLVVLFLLFISFTVFAVLNVITGVFCEAAIEGARQDNEMMVQQHLAEKAQFTSAIYSLFGVQDRDGEVTLTYAEFVHRLSDPRTKAHLAAISLDVNDAWELFRLLDTDDSAIIDVEEFVVGCLRLKGFAKAVDLAKLDYESKIRAKKLTQLMGSLDRKLCAISKHLSVPPRTDSALD